MKHEFPNDREILARLAPVRGGVVPETDARRIFALVAWSVLVEPGDGVAGRLVATLGPEEGLRRVVVDLLDAQTADAAGITPAEFRAGVSRWTPRLDMREASRALDTAARAGIRLIVPGDAEWPTRVDDLGAHAPLCLWVRGDIGALARADPAVALVGARAATGYGEHVAMEFASELAGRGVSVVSGAAYGIDGMAHRATLAAGGRTLALLAGGVDRPYPSGHANLLERIASSGAVVSEVPCGGAPTKWRFLMRNRLIAALGSATVVVEAGWRSGSLNTAGHAAALGRPIGAVPGPVTSAASAGCHRLLREFDASCVTSVDDIMELLGDTTHAKDAGVDAGGPTGDVTRVLDALTVRAWRETGDVARRSGLGIAEVEAILGVLSLDGTALRDERGWRRTASTG